MATPTTPAPMIAKSMVSDGGMKLRALAREAMLPVAVLLVSEKAGSWIQDLESLITVESLARQLEIKCADTTTD